MSVLLTKMKKLEKGAVTTVKKIPATQMTVRQKVKKVLRIPIKMPRNLAVSSRSIFFLR